MSYQTGGSIFLWKKGYYINFLFHMMNICARGGARNFSDGGLTLPTRGLKYGFQGTINAKKFGKNRFHLPTGS